MRLLEAITQANHRAAAGDQDAGLRPSDFTDALPLVALTCVDPRLNPLLPEVLGIPEEQFIWLRNAGNIITGSLSSTLRSLALACAVKGGREIAIIGHTDCQVGRTGMLTVLERFAGAGVSRASLPENLQEFFGLFASERQNVLNGVEHVRRSPLIGPKVPVHGLLLDTHSGRLEWLVNGYETRDTVADQLQRTLASAGETVDALKGLAEFQMGEMKFPETKIGETVINAADWLSQKIEQAGSLVAPATGPRAAETPERAKPVLPPKLPRSVEDAARRAMRMRVK